MLDGQALEVARPALGSGRKGELRHHARAGWKHAHRGKHAKLRVHTWGTKFVLLVQLDGKVCSVPRVQLDGHTALTLTDNERIFHLRRLSARSPRRQVRAEKCAGIRRRRGCEYADL